MTIDHPYPVFDPLYSNRLLKIKVSVYSLIERGLNFIGKTKVKLKTGLVSGIKKRLINALYKDLGKIYIMVEGLNKVISECVEDIEIDEYKRGYSKIEKILSKYSKYHNILENVSFFDNSNIEDVSNKILLDLHRLESKLRFLSFTEDIAVDGDEELRKTASLISLKAAQSLHAI